MSINATIAALFNTISANQSPAREIEALVKHFQHDSFFQLALAKEARVAHLKAHFAREFSGRVYLPQKVMGLADIAVGGVKVCVVEDGTLARCMTEGTFKNSILIVNNNDVMRGGSPETYFRLFQASHDTILVVWDYDNHHLYPLSVFLATYSDMYIPTHPDYFSLLARYNRCIAGPVSSGVGQWSRRFLRENREAMISTVRSDLPLGMHIFWQQFRFRNQVVSTLAKHYPSSVGFETEAFHKLSAEERLRRWFGHKAHWVVPVLADIPTRLFDALITGGVPIVPDTHKHYPNIAPLAQHIVFYRAHDIASPQGVVAEANRKFDERGRDGIIERYNIAMEQHHVSIRVENIINLVLAEFGITPNPSGT